MLRALNHDMAIDVCVTVLTLAIHWGSFSGLLTSVGTTLGKKAFG
jgi:hypothetical protein